jgi:hypothetical protein
VHCLPPADQTRLAAFPPKDIDEFAREVFIAEGVDPAVSDRRLLTEVRNLVAEAFVDCATE